MQYRYLAAAVCSVRRIDPKRYLNILFQIPENTNHVSMCCRLLRLSGELKRVDLLPIILPFQHHANEDIAYWAHWSTLLLGDRTNLSAFESLVLCSGPHQIDAINIAFRCLEHEQVWQWINKLIKQPQQIFQTIVAIATLGDPHSINWLLTRMEEKPHARMAGYAFAMITGVDLAQHNLISRNTPDFDDDDKEALSMPGGYENLPMPDAEKVNQHWQTIRHQFHAGQRYLSGRVIEDDHLKKIIIEGTQAQRFAAALEVSLRNKNSVYPNVKAPLPREGDVK